MERGDDALELDGLTFLWNRAKASANRCKHGVTFEEAATVFADPLAVVRADRSTAHDEASDAAHGLFSLGTAASGRPRPGSR